MEKIVNSKLTVLKQYFGHSEFRPGQEKIIDALLSGRDVLGVMPTGAGKSVCYQIPALLFDGVTLIISPLISLMKDQVAALLEAGIPAAFINSSLNTAQQQTFFRRAQAGQYKIIYVAPERLLSADFLNFSKRIRISLVAVDEAHCVSQWGQDFRPSYLKITDFIEKIPEKPAIGAFTATATAEVKDDIARLLRLCNPLRVTTGFDRPNLYFEVDSPKSKSAYLNQYIDRRRMQSGIVYCATRKLVESVCASLQEHKITATRYHAGLPDEERRQNQEDFVYDRARIMVATNAFGMGIDKSNVSFVVHYNMPTNLESYYQEAGRAGRDGEHAECILLFSNSDVATAKFLIRSSKENEGLTEDEHKRRLQYNIKKLKQMTGYCKTNHCLRTYILAYFDEKNTGNCGNCGNCKSKFKEMDITIEAQKILSAVTRVEKKYPNGLGVTLIVRMLHGSREQRITQLELDKFPTYGIMRDTSRSKIREYIELLIQNNYLELTPGEYSVLRSTKKAGDVLQGTKQVIISIRDVIPNQTALRHQTKEKEQAPEADDLLYSLKALRTRLAMEENIPAYIVFSNAALADMASKKPRTAAEFLQVSGVGEVKAKRYGIAFLKEINKYLNQE